MQVWRPLPMVLVLCAALAVSGPGLLRSAFQYDDLHAIVGNQHLHSLTQIPMYFTDPGAFSSLSFGGMFRPLVLVSYALTDAVAGEDPVIYHLGNVALHTIAGMLVTRLLLYLGTGAVGAAVGGVWFIVHPVNVEVSSYISARSESLCLVFLLLSFYLWLARDATGRPGWRDLAGPAAFAAALLSKSVAIVLPLILLLHDRSTQGPIVWRPPLVRRHGPYWFVAGLYLLWMAQKLGQAMGSEAVRGPALQIWTQCKALIYYLRLLVVPRGLSVEHAFEVSDSALEAPVLLALLALTSLALLALRCPPGQRFWLVWMPLVLLPTLLVPLNVLVNEHRLYPATVAGAVLLAPVLRSSRLLPAAIVLLVVLGVLSHQRAGLWEDGLALWSDARDKAPVMPRPHLFVGDSHFAAGHYETALASYATAERVRPDHLTPGDRLALHNNRGAALLALGRHAESILSYEEALRIVPDYPPSVHSLAALRAMSMGSERDPTADALARRGLRALAAGELARAEDLLRQSLGQQEHGATRLALGVVLERGQRWTEAEALYRVLVLTDSDSMVAADAQRRLQEVLAVAPSGATR